MKWLDVFGMHTVIIPGAVETPTISIEHIVVPSSQNPLGVKGVGESGLVPVPAVVSSAIEDALSDLGTKFSDIPIGPSNILNNIRNHSVENRAERLHN